MIYISRAILTSAKDSAYFVALSLPFAYSFLSALSVSSTFTGLAVISGRGDKLISGRWYSISGGQNWIEFPDAGIQFPDDGISIPNAGISIPDAGIKFQDSEIRKFDIFMRRSSQERFSRTWRAGKGVVYCAANGPACCSFVGHSDTLGGLLPLTCLKIARRATRAANNILIYFQSFLYGARAAPRDLRS